MRAMVLDGFGGPQALREAELPVPLPGQGEVLVRVHAAGVNAIDWLTRAGHGVGVAAFPAVLGWDLSGTVAALGPGVTGLAVGDAVFGMPRFPALARAYAEYTVAPAGELARKPARLAHHTAAGVPMVALTAWQTLVRHAQLDAGQRVLVSDAAGGVGQVAVQLARAAGAEVIGTAAPEHHAFVRSLGAHQVLDDTRGPAAVAVKDVDVVVDPRGGTDFFELLDTLRPGGIIVTLEDQQAGQEEAVHERGLRVGHTYVDPDRAALAEIARMLTEGRLSIAVDRVLPLAEAAAAHRLGESGRVRGRLVLSMEST